VVARSEASVYPNLEIFAPASRREAIVAALEAHGARRASDELVEGLRVEAARPAFGRDMTSDTIPLEAGLLDRAISTTKGCYVGQEIIIRVLHRGGGRVARRLVQIALDEQAEGPVTAGAAIFVNGKEAGRITSSGFSPRVGRFLALGYVTRAAAEPGTRVAVEVSGGHLPAEITALAG
jgi:folate-binding protein YgfZ